DAGHPAVVNGASWSWKGEMRTGIVADGAETTPPPIHEPRRLSSHPASVTIAAIRTASRTRTNCWATRHARRGETRCNRSAAYRTRPSYRASIIITDRSQLTIVTTTAPQNAAQNPPT